MKNSFSFSRDSARRTDRVSRLVTSHRTGQSVEILLREEFREQILGETVDHCQWGEYVDEPFGLSIELMQLVVGVNQIVVGRRIDASMAHGDERIHDLSDVFRSVHWFG